MQIWVFPVLVTSPLVYVNMPLLLAMHILIPRLNASELFLIFTTFQFELSSSWKQRMEEIPTHDGPFKCVISWHLLVLCISHVSHYLPEFRS